MKDDNQKTFADLFSSASGSDVNDSSTKDNDHLEKSDSSITFGSLFESDSVSSNNVNDKEDTNIVDNGFDLNTQNDVSVDVSNDFSFFSDNAKDDSSDGDNLFVNQDVENTSQDDDVTTNDDSSVNNVDLNLFGFDNNSSQDDVKSDNLEFNDGHTNMFFEQDSNSIIEDKVNTLAEKKDSNVDDDKTVESVSPFFQEEEGASNSSNNDNPLLLGTLNLVENEKEEKMVSSIDVSKSKHFNVKIVKKKEPLFHVILGVLSYALFIWLLLVGVVLLVYVLDIKIRAQKGDYSAPTYNAYVVLTGSMLPKIQVYDVVITKKVEPSELKVGDVITFASADTRFLNTIITHRIIKKNYDPETKSYSFQTRGDNNNVADSALVPQNNIYGRVFLKIPKLGYLQEFLASDGGWIIVILIPCLAVISYDIVKLIKGLRRKKYKNIKVQK